MRLADEAAAVMVTLDVGDVAVQSQLAACDSARGIALSHLGRDGEYIAVGPPGFSAVLLAE